MTDPLILAFDTSAAHCAAALLRGEEILCQRLEPMARGQAERLMPLLEELLTAAGTNWTALDALAVGIGPGNFTGIRISVSAARGLALSLGRPALGIGTLEAMAEGSARPCLTLLDARRGAVYAQSFSTDGSDPLPAPALTDPAALPAPGSLLRIATPELDGQPPALPLAEAIGRVALRRLAAGAPFSRPAPLYLRDADAAPPSEAPPALLP